MNVYFLNRSSGVPSQTGPVSDIDCSQSYSSKLSYFACIKLAIRHLMVFIGSYGLQHLSDFVDSTYFDGGGDELYFTDKVGRDSIMQ